MEQYKGVTKAMHREERRQKNATEMERFYAPYREDEREWTSPPNPYAVEAKAIARARARGSFTSRGECVRFTRAFDRMIKERAARLSGDTIHFKGFFDCGEVQPSGAK